MKDISKLFKKSYICFLLFICGISIITISYIYTLNRIHIGISFILSSITYYFLPLDLNLSYKENEENNNNDFKVKILFGFFLFLITVNFFLIRIDLYHRPFLFFLISSLMSSMIGLQIMIYSKHRYIYLILGEILILSTLLSSSVYFEFPSLYGIDPFYHAGLIEDIVKSGYIPTTSQGIYNQMPIMHIESSIIQILLNSDTKPSYFFLSLIEKFSIIFIFLISSSLIGRRAGLISAIIFGISDYTIMWGFWFIPMIMGFTYIMVIIYIFNNKTFFSLKWSILILALSFLLIYTHPIATLVLILLTLVLYILNKVDNQSVIKLFTYLLFLVIATLNVWMNIYNHPGQSFFSTLVLSIKDAINIDVKIGDISAVTSTAGFSQIDIALNEMGYALLILSGIIGLFILIRKKQLKDFFMFIWFWLFFSIIYIPSFLNISILLPARFFIFMYVPMSIATSVFLVYMSNFNNKYMVYSIFIFILSFFMITSPATSNPESPIYAKVLAGRNAFLSGEVVAADFIKDNIKNPISRDLKYTLFKESNVTDTEEKHILDLNPTDNTTYIPNQITRKKYRFIAIIVRVFNIEKGFKIFRKRKPSDNIQPIEDFVKYLETRDIIYYNGDVKIYI